MFPGFLFRAGTNPLVLGAIIAVGIFALLLIAAAIQRMRMTPEQRAEHDASMKKRADDKRAATDAGRYISGHPGINQPLGVRLLVEGDLVVFIKADITGARIGSIPLASIEDVVVEDQSTMERRVTATRLLAVGIFAFAMKKGRQHVCFYVTVSWSDGRFKNNTIFEFVDPNPLARANALLTMLRNAVNTRNG